MFKPVCSKEQLNQLYTIDQKSTTDIAKLFNTYSNKILYNLRKFNINIRLQKEAMLISGKQGKLSNKRHYKKPLIVHNKIILTDEQTKILLNKILLNEFDIRQLSTEFKYPPTVIHRIISENTEFFKNNFNNNKEKYKYTICQECWTYCFLPNGLSTHIVQKHKISKKDYYDKYFKKEREGVCQLEDCNNETKFLNLILGYSKHCCYKHSAIDIQTREKCKETSLEKYGVTTPSQSNIIKEKQKYTFDNKTEEIIKEWSDKIKETCLKKYGVENYSKSNEYKELWKNEEWIKKIHTGIYNTKKQNNSFHTSKPEDELYQILLKHYLDTKRNYRSQEYPFSCDFYIPKLNLYIELNNNWTHGGCVFNPNNEEHIGLVNFYKQKSKELNFKGEKKEYYNNVIYTWTQLDSKKREIARENNLNYLEIFSFKNEKDVLNQINDLNLL